jgi:hypothetical protein
MRHVDLEIPRQGAGVLLQQLKLASCDPVLEGPECLRFAPYLNDLIPTCETEFADLTIDDATMGEHVLCDDGDCTGFVEGPSLNPDEWSIIIDQNTWTLGADPGPVVAYGMALWVVYTTPQLVGIKRFSSPLALATFDIVKVTATLPLLCNIAPVV